MCDHKFNCCNVTHGRQPKRSLILMVNWRVGFQHSFQELDVDDWQLLPRLSKTTAMQDDRHSLSRMLQTRGFKLERTSTVDTVGPLSWQPHEAGFTSGVTHIFAAFDVLRTSRTTTCTVNRASSLPRHWYCIGIANTVYTHAIT